MKAKKQNQKKTYKPVQISPEYHKLLSIYAANEGKTKKQAFEDLLDTAFKKTKLIDYNKEGILCLN